MYYPIIDKLKTLIADIASVKSKEPLIIEGTPTSTTGGTWIGNYSDITEAFSINRMVLFKTSSDSGVILIPVIQNSPTASVSSLFPSIVSGTISIVIGTLFPDNTFNLAVIG